MKYNTKINIGSIGKVALCGFTAIAMLGHAVGVKAVNAPQVINYQAQIMKGGNQFEDRPLDLRFSFWSDGGLDAGDIDGNGFLDTAATEYVGFTEEFVSVTPNVEGIVNIKIGSTVALPVMDADIVKFLQVEIKLEGEPYTMYEVLDPSGTLGDGNDRRELDSVPYALNAGTLQGHTIGTMSGQIALIGSGNVFDPSLIPEGTDANIFRIDHDGSESSGELKLEFGSVGFGTGSIGFDLGSSTFNFNNDIDFGLNEAKNFVLENSSGAPTGAVSGQMYFDTTLNAMRFYDGTQWVAFTGTGGVTTPGLDSIELVPEFGAMFVQDGTNNKGSMFAEFENVEDKVVPYYEWNTVQPSTQDIDLVTAVSLPDNFDYFDGDDSMTVRYKTGTGSGTLSRIEVSVKDTTGNSVTLVGNNILSGTGWSEAEFGFGSGSTFEAGDDLELDMKMFASDNSAFARLGKIVLHYHSK